MKTTKLVLMGVIATLVATGWAQAQTYNFQQGVVDGTGSAGAAAGAAYTIQAVGLPADPASFGGDSAMATYPYLPLTATNGYRSDFLQFGLAAAAGVTVQSATFSLNSAGMGFNPGDLVFNLYAVPTNNTPTQATASYLSQDYTTSTPWLNADGSSADNVVDASSTWSLLSSLTIPSTDTAELTALENGTGSLVFNLDSSIVQGWINNPSSNEGFVVEWITPGGNANMYTSTAGSQSPELSIVADVPEPSTVALVGLGALGIVFLIRRRIA